MALFGKPRVFRLAEVASRAELLRRKRQVRGVALQAGFAIVAAAFALLLLIWLHLTAWAAMAGSLGPAGAALALVVLDLAVVLGLGVFAGRRRADAMADEAIAVRNAALGGAELEARTLGGLIRSPAIEPPVRGRRVRTYPAP